MWELAQRFWEICYAYLRHCLRTSGTQRRLKNVVRTERWPPLFFSLIQHNFMLNWMREDIDCCDLLFDKNLHILHSWGFESYLILTKMQIALYFDVFRYKACIQNWTHSMSIASLWICILYMAYHHGKLKWKIKPPRTCMYVVVKTRPNKPAFLSYCVQCTLCGNDTMPSIFTALFQTNM